MALVRMLKSDSVVIPNKASCLFESTGVAFVGPYTPECGKLDVFLDGEKITTLDTWVAEHTYGNNLWHRFDLKP